MFLFSFLLFLFLSYIRFSEGRSLKGFKMNDKEKEKEKNKEAVIKTSLS